MGETPGPSRGITASDPPTPPIKASLLLASDPARLSRFARVSTALSLHGDEALTRLVDCAEQLAAGIGGSTLAFDIEGVRVFARRLRLPPSNDSRHTALLAQRRARPATHDDRGQFAARPYSSIAAAHT